MMNYPREERSAEHGAPVFSSAGHAPNSARPPAQQAIRLELVRSLRMHSKLAGCVAAVVFLLVVAYALTRKPVYKAESLIYVEPLATKVLSDGTTGTYDPSRYDSYLQQQLQTVQRRDTLAAAVEQLPQGTWRFPAESEESAVTRLQNSLKVERVQNSYQLEITLSDSNPAAAAAVVNAVVKAYLDQGRKDDHARADQKLQLLIEERTRIQTELAQDKTEQATLSASLGVANPAGEMGNQYDLQLAGVRSQLAAAREAHDVAAAQLSSVTSSGAQSTAGLTASADDLISTDAGLSSMKATISQRRAVLSSQMAGLTPSNPVYKQDQEEIAGLDRTLDKMTAQLRGQAERRLQDKLRLDLQRTGDIEARLNSQLARQTATATGAAPKLQRATELAANMQRLSTRYAAVDDAIRGLELETGGPGAAHLALAAEVPTSPEPSKQKLLLLLALPLALLAGALAAVFARKRDPHVYTGRDMEDILGFQPLGVLPASHEVSGAVMEEFTLRLAAGLQGAYRANAARSFVFTPASSATDVHGFIDAVQDRLNQLGFTSTVIDAGTLLRPLSADVSPALPGAGREGYATAHIEHLKRSNDLVLIDAPTLLHSATTEYAARCADATILIAEAGVTTRDDLNYSAALLHRLHVRGVAAVLQGLRMQYAGPAFESRIAAIDRQQESREAAEARLERRTMFTEKVEIPVAAPVAVPAPLAVQDELEPLDAKKDEPHIAETFAVQTQSQHIADVPVVSHIFVETKPAPLTFDAMPSFTDPYVADEDTPRTKSSWFPRLFTLHREPMLSIVPEPEEFENARPAAHEPVDDVATVIHAAPVEPAVQTLEDELVMPAVAVETSVPESSPSILFVEKPAVEQALSAVDPVPEFVLSPVVEPVAAAPLLEPAAEPARVVAASHEAVFLAEPAQIEIAADVAQHAPINAPISAPVLPDTITVSPRNEATELNRADVSLPASGPKLPVVRLAATTPRIDAGPLAARERRGITPLAVTSFPGVATSIATPRAVRQEASAPLQMPAVDARHRLGLTRAAAYQGPARASEGLEATKQASAERRAAARVETEQPKVVASPDRDADRNARSRAAVSSPAPAEPAPLTRRWGMLSRFDRTAAVSREDYPQATGTLGDR